MGSKSGLFGVLFCWLKYVMEYKLYTLVDITHTGQNRLEIGKEHLRSQEQNFNTVIHTLGIRSNITWVYKPAVVEMRGRLVGFDTDEIIKLWRFDWATENGYDYEQDQDPIGMLKQDFQLVPYIKGLTESMEQAYPVFITDGPGRNIVFFQINHK
jgi:hypothetical protein